MNKKTIKHFVPATFDKIESANKVLLEDIKQLVSTLDDKIIQLNKKNNHYLKRILNQEAAILKLLKEIHSSESNIAMLQNQILSAEEFLKDTQEQILISENNLSEQGKEYLDKFNEINIQLNKINTEISSMDKKYVYNNNYERKVIQSFYDMYERPDFQEKFQRLVDGLEPDDIALIVKILQRQRIAKTSMDKNVDVFSLEEQQKIKTLKKELDNEIFRVSDNMFCFKHYFLPIRHFEASVFIYKHGIDCIEKIDAIKDKDILDVGGFIGDSILVLKPLTNKRVISFEAVSENYDLMQQTIQLNHLDNVIAEKIALGRENGIATIEVAGSTSAMHSNGVVSVKGEEEVQIKTLDSYINGTDITPGLIKVDIEGAEQDFMEGAKETIAKYKPILLMSIYHNADDFFNIKPIIESWNLGYKFRIHKPVDYSVSREVLLIAEVR